MSVDSPLLKVSISARYEPRHTVLSGITLEIQPGEVLGLAGVSGSGKSTLALAILRLLGFRGGVVEGRILWRDRDLNSLSERALRQIRGREIAYMPQSPVEALNPMLSIDTQLWEAWKAHSTGGRTSFLCRMRQLMEAVGLPHDDTFIERLPRQLSVGQAQRILIAMALLHRPALLIADEPTSALDVMSRVETLRLLRDLNRETGMALLFVSHDLAAVAALCDRVAILHNGVIVENGATEDVFRYPEHHYTKQLIQNMPRAPQWNRRDQQLKRPRVAIG